MEQGFKKSTLNNLVVAIIILIFIIVLVIDPIRRNSLLNGDVKYTIGIIIKIEAAVNGGPDATFKYCVDNNIYYISKDIGMYKDSVNVGDSCIVKYSIPHPKICKIYFDNETVDETLIPTEFGCDFLSK